MRNWILVIVIVVCILCGFGTYGGYRYYQQSQQQNWLNSTIKAGLAWEEANRVVPNRWVSRIGNYNLVLVTVNLLRADHMSVYGYGRKNSPAMDKLAQESFVFSNMFTNADYTMPNMMSVITSLYPVSHGVFDAYKDQLSNRVTTLAQILQKSGYATSWYALQMPHLDVNVGFGRGYDTIVELQKDYSNVDDITDWIQSHKDEPFFVGVNSRSIHPPYIPPPEFKDRFYAGGNKGNLASTEEEFNRAWYENILELMETPDSCMDGVIPQQAISDNRELFNGEFRVEKIFQIETLIPEEKKIRFGFTHMMTFLQMVDPKNRENLDYAISLYDGCVLGIDQKLVLPIVEALRQAGVYDNTIIVITGDHGESLGEHQYVGHNNNFYEQLVHVPLLIRHPDLSKRVNISELAQSLDIMPTLLDLVGIDQPFQTQGASLVPLLEDNTGAPLHSAIFGEKRKQAYMRTKEWKLVIDLEHDPEARPCKWARLYNILQDPEERDDKCTEHKEILQGMLRQLTSHLDETPRHIDKEYQFLQTVDEKTRKRIRETGYW